MIAATLMSVCLVGSAMEALPVPENVPELLVSDSGNRITTSAQWERERRPELLRTFEQELYGKRPSVPLGLSYETVVARDNAVDGLAKLRRVKITYRGPCGTRDFVVTAFFPKCRKGPAPVFVYIAFDKDGITSARSTGDCHAGPFQLDERWPVKKLISRGYATVAFRCGHIVDDDEDGFRTGVYSALEDYRKRTDSSWGAISAWAWGASRVADWLETEPLADTNHLAVVGHSRLGKSALWAGATDCRFALTCASGSGCCGAKLNHIELNKIKEGYWDEHVERILRFRHWFARRFDYYRGKDLEMPFDQHQLIALCAPRLVAIASASEDEGAGPLGEYWAARLASPAWELYGRRGLVTSAFPETEHPEQEGFVSYHLRKGGHDLVSYDWERFMDFADRHGWNQ